MRCHVFKKMSVAAMLAATFALPVCAQVEPLAGSPVVHVEILGADAPRLQSFYRELFGWQAKLNPVGYGYVAVAPPAGTPLTGGIGPSPQRQPLVIGKNRARRHFLETCSPDIERARQRRRIGCKRRVAEMPVDGRCAVEQGGKAVPATAQRQR